MPMQSKPKWSDVKQGLKGLEHRQLVELIQALYQLSQVNKDFLHARFGDAGGSLDRYKNIIEKSLCPGLGGTFQYKKAKNAIRDYSKATSDIEGMADLMIYYVECGNDFTLEYGDIDEAFYDQLLEMYDKAIASVLKLPKSKQQSFKDRLEAIRDAADGIGWGYHDGLGDSYAEAFE